MSTEIKSISESNTLSLSYNDHGVVWIGLYDESGGFERAAFLAAVESELDVRIVPADAVVIDRSELPDVKPVSSGDVYVNGSPYMAGTYAGRRETALLYLAIADYLAAHPPVDQAQVDAMTDALVEVGMDDTDGPVPAEVARRLAIAGYAITRKDGA